MKTIYACEEHIDEAMDEIINENETFPVINEVSEKECTYCGKKCRYEVKII